MADIRLVKPQANAVHNVPCATGNRFVLEFPSDAALFAKDGDDLVLSFEDGSSIRLQDFYTTYSKEEMPSFEMEGAEISGEDFFAALGNPDLMPAAGPSATVATRGGGFNQYGNVELLQGIDRLGGLDISFNWGQEHEDDLYAYGHRDIDYGVSVVPVVPGILDPDIPVVDDPDNPNDGGVGPVVDRLEVWEAGLANGSNPQGENVPTMAHGGMNISAPDGVATIVIGKVTVYANGHLVRGSDGAPVKVDTGEGYLQVTGFNPATGRLEYTYTLRESTQEHSREGADKHFTYFLPVTVTDSDGDSGSSTIAVVIKDDEPTAHGDANSVKDGNSEDVVCSGNVLDGTRSDGGKKSDPDVIGADGHMSDESKVKWETDGLEYQGGNTYKTDYGTITLYADGSYKYILDETNLEVMKLTGDLGEEPLKDIFTYTITDKDGDKDTAELTITITGADHEVAAFTPKNLTVNEALLPDGSTPGSGQEVTASGSFAVVVKDGLGGLLIDGKEVELVFADDGTVTVADRDVHYDDPKNTGEGTGKGYLTIDSVERNEDGYTYTVNYTYHLTEATQEHAEEGADSLSEQNKQHAFQVTVVDQDKDEQSATISIDIKDDVADAQDDRNSVKEKDPSDNESVETSGNVIKGERGDDPNDQSGKDTVGADGASVTHIAAGSEGTAGTGNEVSAAGTTIKGEYGTLTIRPDGSYTYTLDESNRDVMALYGDKTLQDVFTYTLTDKDGDKDTAELTIVINGKNHNTKIEIVSGDPLVVDETDLQNNNATGNQLQCPEDSQAADTETSGSLTITALDGLQALVINGTEYEVLVENGKVTGLKGSPQIWDDEQHTGYLTIDSIVDDGKGTYTVDYTYHLDNSTQDHDAPAEETESDRNHLTEDQQKDHSFTINAKDQDRTPSESVEIKVDIIDDIPVLTGNQASTSSVAIVKEQDLASPDNAVAEIDLAPAFEDTVSVGADGLGSVSYELKLSGASGAPAESVETTLMGLEGNGYKTIFLVKGDNGSILGVTDRDNPEDSTCFTITIDSEGTATLTLLRPVQHKGEGNVLGLQTKPDSGSFTVEYTVTDKDGDHVSTSMDLGTGNVFKIEDWETKVTAKGSADLTVDESYTVTRPNQKDNQDPDRLASGDGNDKGAESNVCVFDAYKLFDIELGADDTGLEGIYVNGVSHPVVDHVFTLGFTKSDGSSSDASGEISSGLYGIYADAEGKQQTQEILLSLDEETNTITGYCGEKEVFTLTINEEGKLTLTMINGSGVSIVHDNNENSFDEVAALAALANKINVTLTVTDRDGDTNSATANVNLKFEDDGPALELPAAVVITSEADTASNTGTLSGKMTFDFGADGAAFEEGVQAMVVKVTDGGTVYTFNCVKNENGVWSATLGEEDEARSFTINSDGTFTYSRPLTTDGTDTNVSITVTLTDGDGDTITAPTTEYAPVVTTTDSGDLQEAGVAGCTDKAYPNAPHDGTYQASGTISLEQSSNPNKFVDDDRLTLQGWSATLTHTPLTDGSDDAPDTPGEDFTATYVQKDLGSLLGIAENGLVLYLKVDENGHPVLSKNAPEQEEEFYGTLTFTPGDDPDSEWNWKFNLEKNDLTNSMTEQEKIELQFDFKVSDGMLQGGGALYITIQGSNDRPFFTCDCNGVHPDAVGEVVVSAHQPADGETSKFGTTFGDKQLTAWDPDTDNGEGSTDADENHLRFTVVKEVVWNAGKVSRGEDGELDYTPYALSNSDESDRNELLQGTHGEVSSGTDGDGRHYTSITTSYGTLRVYEDGSYSYTARDTARIGEHEYVTETFTIRVTDAHGSYSDKKIVITLRDTDHPLDEAKETVELTVKEGGVAGDDPDYNKQSESSDKAYNEAIHSQPAIGSALFTDADVNNTLTLTIKENSTISTNQGAEETEPGTVSSDANLAIKVGIGGTHSEDCSLVAYEGEDGQWTFAWTLTPENGADVVGTLYFYRDPGTGAVTPTFTLNNDSNYLDQLSQGDRVTVTLPLTATSSGNEDRVVNSELQITIEGTNDRPTMELSTDRDQLTVNELEESVSSESTSQSIQGAITASDIDWDYNLGVSEGEPAFVYTLHGFKSDDEENVLQTDGSVEFRGDNAGVFDEHYTTIETTYGKMELHDDSTFTYTLHEPGFLEDGATPNAVLALAEGQSVTETFIIRVTDNHGSWTEKPITITINGTNDAPVLTFDNLEVHATEDNIPDKEIHEGVDLSSVTVTAKDYDYGADLSYWFHDSGSNTDTQFIRITAEQLLEIINNNGVYKGAPASLKVLQAILQNMNDDAPIATLRLSETGELTLEVNQESVFIQALNRGDNLTFTLSDIAPDVEIVARDEHDAYSDGAGVTLVVHGNDDDYTPVSVVVPHVKEEGVYRDNIGVITDTTDAGEGQNFEQPGYGQHQLSNSGKFTINDRDAGQITFSQGDNTWKESGTELGGEKIAFGEGIEPAGPMYVLGTYGYYVIDLSSTMDANGTKTFDYTYHLYSDEKTPHEIKNMVDKAFTESDPQGWEGRLDAVDSIAQGSQVRDNVTISVSTDNGTTNKKLTLESIVSGSNDSPKITGVATVDNPEEGTALTVSENASEANTMYLAGDKGGQTLHITLQVPESGETSHFVGEIVGEDPDTEGSDGTTVVNYAFVSTTDSGNSSANVWSISEDGESASSEYGYITIDADGVFHIHLYEDAAKALGKGEISKQDIFEGLGVRCIDDLGATSNIVELSGHLLGVDDAATATGSREDLWEGVHEHDTSIPAQDPAPHDKPLAEKDGVVEGKVVVSDPDSSDTFSNIVTVTIGDKDRTLVFDDDGKLSKVDDENASVLKTDKGEFGFTLTIEGNEATLTYTYKVNDQGLDEIDKLDDGDFVKGFESIDVSFTSIPKDEEGNTTEHGTSSATISIDVHGTNDAPVIETVQTAHGEPIKITDDSAVVSGGTLKPKGQTSGKITATDPDEGETSELTYGILIYRDEKGTEHIVYGQTGEDGTTQYVAVDGFDLPKEINLDNLTFTNHADLVHGSIYVDDAGNYTYSRYPNDNDDGFEMVFITVRDPDGAMDHVKIKFDLEPGDGGRLPDVTMSGDIPLEVTEPSDEGDRVHVGDEGSSASSFTQEIAGNLSITVYYYLDSDGNYHLLDKEGDSWVNLNGSPIPEDVVVQTASGKLEPTGEGSYSWVYTDENGETLEGFTVPLDIRLTPEGEEYGWDDGTYSLQTDYGTVYVDRVTGELRFELDSRADTLNAGEVHSESVVIWINGNPQDVSLDVTETGTADASEVETDALSVDLEDAGDETTIGASGTLTIDDIDNDAGAKDNHVLSIEVTGEDGEPKSLEVENGTTIYVMAGEDGTLVYTDVKPEDDERNSCYGELSFTLNEDGTYDYDYTFTAYTDSAVSKEIQDNDHLDLRVPVMVTDIAPDADSYPEGGFDEEHYQKTTTKAEIAITVTGKADAPDVTDSSLDITEEGTTLEGQGDGSHSVTGRLEIVDYDDSGVTVTGIEGELKEGETFENGSTVVPGRYGTLVLHNDGTYTYTVNYDEVQDLAQVESLPDVFTVAVGNKGGQSLATITVNVHGTNDVPTVTVTPVLTVQEQHGVTEAITVSGRVEAQDIDTKDDLSYGFSTGDESGELVSILYVVGTWEGDKLVLSTSTTEPTDASSLVGTLTMAEDGEYTFTLADSETTRGLPHGESAEIVVQAGASDSHAIVTRPVTITIKGSNEAPEVTTNITIDEDDLVNDSSVIVLPDGSSGYTATDADMGTTLSYTFSRNGEYRTTETGTITIGGIEYQVGLVIDPGNGAITISYEDSDSVLQELINALGKDETLAIDTEGLQVVVQDGEGGRTSSELTLTIQGANDAPVIENATMNNNQGSLTFSDVDTSDKHTISVLVDGTPYEMSADSNEIVVNGLGTFTFERTENGWDYSFVADSETASAIPSGKEEPYSFKLQVSDGTESDTTEEDLTVTVTGTGQETEEGQDLELPFADADMALFTNMDSLDTLAPLSNSQDDNPADTAQFSGARADTSSQSQNPEDMDSPFENALRLLEDPDSEGTELFFARNTYSLADGEEMYSLSPDDPEENTIDIVAYDSTDYMVDGGEGVSFMVSENEDLTMDDILQGDGQHGPIVSNIDVLITGHGAESLTNMDQLARDYGISVDRDANALTLDESWQKVDSGQADTQVFSNGSLTLETSLDVSCPSDDLNVQAAMHQVTNN